MRHIYKYKGYWLCFTFYSIFCQYNCKLFYLSPNLYIFYGDDCYSHWIFDARITSENWNLVQVIQFLSICASWGKALDLVLQPIFHPILQRKWPSRLRTKRNDTENPNLQEEILKGFAKRWWIFFLLQWSPQIKTLNSWRVSLNLLGLWKNSVKLAVCVCVLLISI